VLGAMVALAMSGCAVTVGGPGMGPGMPQRMGQGSSRCDVAPPTTRTTVRVLLTDMSAHGSAGDGRTGGMMRGRMMLVAVPRTVTAGPVTLVAVNHGSRTHELVVLPLGPHTPAGRRPVGSGRAVGESTAVGEASYSCGAGTGRGIAPGQSGWTTVDLTRGRYELVCNRPGHYARGMYAVLRVR
jgi:uncharacterized cupredoxin-like copper-binding protein